MARLLQGKALEVYQRLTDEEVDDYEVLKVQLLKRFRLTEGGYRKKFKMSKLEPGKSPEQFVEQLRRYLEKWRVMTGYEARYDSLEDMIIRDQYFLTCDKSLQTFLKEKGKLSLKETTNASNDYYEAHGYLNKQNDGPPNENCGLRNHRTSERKKFRGDQRNTNNMVCFQCNLVGHKQR